MLWNRLQSAWGAAATSSAMGLNRPTKVILANLGQEPFEVSRGDRIAQLVPAAVQRALLAEVDALDDTDRGAGGFGSTGR